MCWFIWVGGSDDDKCAIECHEFGSEDILVAMESFGGLDCGFDWVVNAISCGFADPCAGGALFGCVK